MTTKRVTSIPGLDDIVPRSSPPAMNKDEVAQIAASAGFSTRHAEPPVQTQPAITPPAPSEPAVPQPRFDARTLRKSARTERLHIAVRPAVRDRFWQVAGEMGVEAAEEVLIRLMDAYEKK